MTEVHAVEINLQIFYDDVNLRYKTGDIMFIVNVTVKRP